MHKRFSFFVLIAVLFYGCCTKKACVEEAPPAIEFNFAHPDLLDGSTVVIKTFFNNVVIDSMVITDNFDQHFFLFPFSSHSDDDGRLKTFEINLQGKRTFITDIAIEFKKEEFNCNECFPVRTEKEFILVHENFSYNHNGHTFFEGELLTLD